MRRIADLHAGEAKTDARDAAIIAEATRTLPHALRPIRLEDEQVAELSMLCGFDDDIVGQMTATSNRIRGLLMQIHPALERVLGPHLDHPAVVDLLQKYPTPTLLKAAGKARLGTRLIKLAPRMGRRLAEEIFQALSEQTVVVGGTHATRAVLPRLAEQLGTLRRQRAEIAVEVAELGAATTLEPIIKSMPGVGVRTAARVITEISGKEFATAGHLASYAGLAPVTRRSGSSIRGEHPSQRGNKVLKRRCSSPLSQLSATPSHADITNARSPRESATTKPSSHWPAAASTCSTPCYATAPFTKSDHHSRLDEDHRGTPHRPGRPRSWSRSGHRKHRSSEGQGDKRISRPIHRSYRGPYN